MINQNTRTALPDDTWGADTRRILARCDDAKDDMPSEEYAALLNDAMRLHNAG